MVLKSWSALVVEDNFDDAQLFSHILTFHGIQVFLAADGNQGLAMVDQTQPTLVITDLALPQKDGWAVLAWIRSQPELAHLTVVAVTAYDSIEVARGAIDAGFDAYFSKPVDPVTFVDQLSDLLNQKRL
jgi:CheY-like chemotaxis protein